MTIENQSPPDPYWTTNRLAALGGVALACALLVIYAAAKIISG